MSDSTQSRHFDLSSQGIIEELSKQVVGQQSLKESIAIALRIRGLNVEGSENLKTNVLVKGPTGSGKTEVMRAIQNHLEWPCLLIKATDLVPEGIVGTHLSDLFKSFYQRVSNNIPKWYLRERYNNKIDPLHCGGDLLIEDFIDHHLDKVELTGTYIVDKIQINLAFMRFREEMSDAVNSNYDVLASLVAQLRSWGSTDYTGDSVNEPMIGRIRDHSKWKILSSTLVDCLIALHPNFESIYVKGTAVKVNLFERYFSRLRIGIIMDIFLYAEECGFDMLLNVNYSWKQICKFFDGYIASLHNTTDPESINTFPMSLEVFLMRHTKGAKEDADKTVENLLFKFLTTEYISLLKPLEFDSQHGQIKEYLNRLLGLSEYMIGHANELLVKARQGGMTLPQASKGEMASPLFELRASHLAVILNSEIKALSKNKVLIPQTTIMEDLNAVIQKAEKLDIIKEMATQGDHCYLRQYLLNNVHNETSLGCILEYLEAFVEKTEPCERTLSSDETRDLAVKDALNTMEINLESAAVDYIQQYSVVFIDEIDKLVRTRMGEGTTYGSSIQRELLGYVEGKAVEVISSSLTHEKVDIDTTNILFIAAGAFADCSFDGLMPELRGRFPITEEIDRLNADEYVRILKLHQSVLNQHIATLKHEGIDVEITNEAYELIGQATFALNQSDDISQRSDIGARRINDTIARMFKDCYLYPERFSGRVVVDTTWIRDHTDLLQRIDSKGEVVDINAQTRKDILESI